MGAYHVTRVTRRLHLLCSRSASPAAICRCGLWLLSSGYIFVTVFPCAGHCAGQSAVARAAWHLWLCRNVVVPAKLACHYG